MRTAWLWTVLAVAMAGWAGPAGAQASAISNCSRTEPSGERTLCHEAVAAAPVERVWALISTSEGMRTWAAPVAAMDLRVGGTFESSYDPNGVIGAPGNIRHRVLAFAPNAVLAMQVTNAPPGFAHEAEIRQLTNVIELFPVDATHTRVRVSMLGYCDGAGFDALYRFFDAGNAQVLGALIQSAEGAP